MSMLGYCIAKARQHVSGGRVCVYSVATNKQGRIIAESGNSYVRTHTFQSKMAKKVGLGDKCFLHAEISVLIGCMRKQIIPAHLYVARVRRDGSIAAAKPCPICAKAIELAGIDIKNVITT